MGERNPVVIILGLDADGKPHAARFTEAEAKAAATAADLMSYHAARVIDPELYALASNLPIGRLFNSGRALVPYVKRVVFDQLATLIEGEIKPAPRASDTAEMGAPIEGEESEDGGPPHDLWAAIEVGNTVLAKQPEGGEGWWEAIVVAVAGRGNVLSVRWRDWPDEKPFMVLRRGVALLHPRPEQN